VAAGAAPRRGGTIVIAMGADPPTLNPQFTTLPYTWMIAMSVYSSLIRLDPAMTPHPDLAESWAISPDLRRFTFKLVRNARWHDGTPFTSADVKFSFEEIARKLNPSGSQVFGDLLGVDAPDPYTAVFRFSQPQPALLLYLDVPLTGAVLPKHVYAGTDIRQNPANAKPIGTGPFRFGQWTRGTSVTLERNPEYFRPGRPYLDRAVFQVVRDPAARDVALENHDVDFIIGYDLALYDTIPLRMRKDTRVVFTVDRAISGQWWIGLNNAKPPFKDVRVRQAVAYAINQQLIWQRVFFGLGKIATGPISQYLGPQYTRDVTKFAYDPQKAAQLLDAAGYPRGAGGVRFRTRFTFDGTSAEFSRIADLLKVNLAAVGIEVDLESFDFNTWFDRVYVKHDYDMARGRHLSGPDAVTSMRIEYDSKNSGPSQRNFYAYQNPDVDRLLAAAAVEPDPAKRLEMTHRLQALIAGDVPVVFLMDTPQPNAYRSAFQGLDNNPYGAQRLENVWVAA